MKFRKPFVITNGIGFSKKFGKPIILDFHKFGQSSHFGAKRLEIRKKRTSVNNRIASQNCTLEQGKKKIRIPLQMATAMT